MAGSFRFQTRLLQTGRTTTGIEVPQLVISKLAAGARPAVAVRVNGYEYRTTVGVMGGKSLLPFSSSHREASGIVGGDEIDVELQLDTAPRTIEVPEDLAQALTVAGVSAEFAKQAPSRQKADAEGVLSAKAAETRTRRIEAIVAKLKG